MAGSVRDLPGVRPGARVYLFTVDDEDGIGTRIEDFDADWLGIAAPGPGELSAPLRPGDPLELELPLPQGSLFMIGSFVERKVQQVPLLVVRVEEVGTDPGVGQSKEARQHFRQPLWLPLRHLAYRDSRGEWIEAGGIVRDVSGGGISLMTDAALPVGGRVALECPVPLEPFGLSALGTVMGSRRTGTDRRPRWIVNVRFDTVDKPQRSWLVGQLHRYQWLVRWRQR
jgi:hypothetical protein